jgi:Ca-activated chloride channel family protein
MPAEFLWLRPAWLWAIPAVILIAVYFARRRLGPGSWEHIIAPALAPYVLSRSAARGSDYRWWILGLAGVLAALALAGPAWERIEQPVFRSEQALVVAVDLSRSMDAPDIAPSRLQRARLKILDILERRGSGQTALLVYSANAFTVTPLTTDNDTIAALVNSLSTDIMPSRGSYPIVAINKGRSLLEQAGIGFGEILLITDGGASPAAERVARDLRGSGYTLSVLGVGTEDGAPIPRQTGGFVTDQAGRIAVPRLEESGLKRLAAAGGGRYARIAADSRDIDALLAGEVAGGSQSTDESLATDQWREEGPWLLLLLLPIAALAFRRGWVMIAVLFVLPLSLSQPVEASVWDDLWLNKDQQAKRQLQAGDAAAAAEIFEDPDWQAVARYRAGDYAGSAAQFAEHGDTRNLYNLGNALALQGEFESAIDAYEQVLEMDPDDEDAAYNLELVKQAQEQQQQQQNEQQESEQQQGEGEQGESDSESEQQEGGEQSDDESEESESGDREQEDGEQEDLDALEEELRKAAEEAEQGEKPQQLTEEQLAELREMQEQEQAMEQWLRRIPNDPGGLLRRKFRYQYQRSEVDQDGNPLWPDDNVQPW